MTQRHPTEVETLGSRLRTIRKAAGMDQKTLGARAGVHEKTISRWENNSQPPGHDELEAVARVLGYRAEWIRTGEGSAIELPPVELGRAARAFVNRFLAELAEAGVTEEEEGWARRLLMNPDNYGFNVGGNTPTLDEDAVMRDLEGMSIGVRHILRARGYTNLPLR